MGLSPEERRRNRCFHRVISGLEKGGSLRLLTLTSADTAVNPIGQDFRRLTMRLQRRGLLRDYIRVTETKDSGRDHMHIIFRGSYIDQAYLSALWKTIHQSPIVDIRAVKGGNKHKRNVASYLAKYMVKDCWKRYSWSWGWVYKGFIKVWKQALQLFRTFQYHHPNDKSFYRFLHFWRDHLHHKTTPYTFLRYMNMMARTTDQPA